MADAQSQQPITSLIRRNPAVFKSLLSGRERRHFSFTIYFPTISQVNKLISTTEIRFMIKPTITIFLIGI